MTQGDGVALRKYQYNIYMILSNNRTYTCVIVWQTNK
jgi:hypothetical protein